jgi:FkbM family methyltransferase
MRGVHELPVCEALWRLCGTGETAVDVGANIGVMTSLLSKRVGETGQVVSFEAHPEIFQQLARNVQRWPRRRVECWNRAVSCNQKTMRIQETECFGINEGTARVANDGAGGRSFEVMSVRLDDVLSDRACGVLKIDVEGHEFEVLSGARSLLESRKVRDIVFESTWEFPGRAHKLLAGYGYQLFDLGASSLGLELPMPSKRPEAPGKVSDYVATLNPERALTLTSPSGWRVLWAG